MLAAPAAGRAGFAMSGWHGDIWWGVPFLAVAATPGIERRRPSLMRTLATKPIAVLLVFLMAVGSLVLWIGIPVGWVWVASRTVKTSQPSFGPYLLVLCAT